MNKEGSNVKALKSGVWYTICNFIVKGAGFLTTPIFTRLLSTSDVGTFANFTSWLGILAVITTFDLFSSVNVARFDYKDNLDEYISSNLLLGSIITSIFYFIVITFKSFFLNLFGFSELELHLAFVYFLVYPSVQMFQLKSRIQYKYKSSVAISLISVFSSTFISLLCVVVCLNKYFGRLMGYIIPLIVVNVIVYIYLLRKGKRVSVKYWKYALMISFPLIWHTLAGNLLNSSDRVMISNYCGSEYTALYSVAYACGFIVSILWTSMNTAWSPWAYEKMDEKDHSSLYKASKPYILFFAIIVFIFLLIAPEIIWIMGGEAYSSAVYVIPPVMLAYVFQFVYSLYVNIEFYFKKQIYIAMGTIIAALINIGLNFIFIPKFGYIAAAYTTLVGYVCLFIIHYLLARKLIKTDWYDSKFIFCFLIIFSLITFICVELYSHRLLRWIIFIGLLASVCAIFLWLRKEIFYLIKYKSMDKIINKINRQRRKK